MSSWGDNTAAGASYQNPNQYYTTPNTWINPNPITVGGSLPVYTGTATWQTVPAKKRPLLHGGNPRNTRVCSKKAIDNLEYDEYHIRGTGMLTEWEENFDHVRTYHKCWCELLQRWVIG